MQGGNVVFFAQLTLIFTTAVFLLLAGSMLVRMRQSQGGKKPFKMFLLVEFMIFVCITMFLLIRSGISDSVAGYLMPAAGLTLAVNLPVIAVVLITQRAAKAKREK